MSLRWYRSPKMEALHSSDPVLEAARAVGDLVAQSVSPGQIKDVQGQLPAGLRDILAFAETAEGVYECRT